MVKKKKKKPTDARELPSEFKKFALYDVGDKQKYCKSAVCGLAVVPPNGQPQYASIEACFGVLPLFAKTLILRFFCSPEIGTITGL